MGWDSRDGSKVCRVCKAVFGAGERALMKFHEGQHMPKKGKK
jgi:hypothetical protein